MEKPFPAYSGDEPYAFICYAHHDDEVVYAELGWLRDSGINVWYDEGIGPGAVWRAELARAIENAAVVVFFASPASVRSEHCNRELNYALDRNRPIVPVYLDPTELPPDLRIGLARVQAIHRRELSRDNYRTKLLGALRASAAEIPALDQHAPTTTAGRLGSTRLVVAAALFGLLVVAGTTTWQMLVPGGPAPIRSLAVLPLSNLSGDPEQEYFADGMTEALITDLGKIRALRVISRTTAMRFKGTDMPLREIALELNVDVVVEGSAHRVGQEAAITVRVIHAATENQLWSQAYQRDVGNVLLLQSELARDIAREIEIAVTPREQALLATAKPVNVEAYEAYLKGLFHWYKLTPQDLETAFDYYEIALEKDPDYALAYVGIADALGTRAHALGLVPSAEVYPQAKAAAQRALDLDDTLAEAHDIMARISWVWDRDTSAAEEGFKQAIALNPNYPYAHAVYSQLLEATGRCEEAIEEALRATELDPHNSFLQLNYAGRLSCLGDYDEAIERLQKVLVTEPNNAIALLYLWNAYHQKGMYDEALGAATKHLELQGFELTDALTRGGATAGYAGAMALAAATLAAHANTTFVQPTKVARLYAHAGQKDLALEWLEKAYEQHDTWMVYVKAEPPFESLRGDPRFKDLMQRIDLADRTGPALQAIQ